MAEPRPAEELEEEIILEVERRLIVT